MRRLRGRRSNRRCVNFERLGKDVSSLLCESARPTAGDATSELVANSDRLVTRHVSFHRECGRANRLTRPLARQPKICRRGNCTIHPCVTQRRDVHVYREPHRACSAGKLPSRRVSTLFQTPLFSRGSVDVQPPQPLNSQPRSATAAPPAPLDTNRQHVFPDGSHYTLPTITSRSNRDCYTLRASH